MCDLYFNELSANFTISTQPDSKEEAKGLLLVFIQTSFSYLLSMGWGNEIYLLTHQNPFSSILLYSDFTIHQLLTELVNENKISDDENSRFKAFITETFQENWTPEYFFDRYQAYGSGEAHNQSSFCVSLSNSLIDGQYIWTEHEFSLQKVSVEDPDENVKVNNISSSRHVFHLHKIWESCSFVNKKPQQQLLPHKEISNIVLTSYTYDNWSNFYSSVSICPITFKKGIARIIAFLNGWKDSDVCPGARRPIYEASNYYLTVDTLHATFEVYKGRDKHLGEIKFNDDTIDESKKKNIRGVCGKKGKK